MIKKLLKTLSLFLLLSYSSLNAQIVSPFNVRYQTNSKGSIKFVSNVSLSCPSSNNSCAPAIIQVPPNGTSSNGAFNMVYVDTDTDPTTFMSSSDSIILPNCSEVLWAGLYWSARILSSTTNYASRDQIKLKVNNGAYQSLTADQLLDVPTINNQTWSHPSYFCFKNVTSLLAGTGLNARFTVADLVSRDNTLSSSGASNCWGGWTIIIVYKNVLQSMRNLTVFDGFANISSGNNLNIPISGFTTPPSGPVSFELGVIGLDGDRDSQGDQLQFDGAGTFVNVFDALHPTTNFFNSTISDNAVLTPYRIPNLNNTLGYDAGIFYPNNTTLNYIGNNTTSAVLKVTTSSENILARAFTSAIDIYEPDLRATVYVQDLNGGQVVPGDILEYKMVGKNIGSDVSYNTFMTDTLDIRTNFVPGSITYSNGPFVGVKTDAFGDDQAEYDPINRCIIARVNTGANAITGGVMNNSPNGADSAVVKFQVQVVNDCLILACDSTLENKGYIFGTGNISGNQFTNNGVSDIYDANGCPTSNNNMVTINSSCPPVDVTHNFPLCLGDTLQFSVPTSLYANYAWFGPNGFNSNLANPFINNITSAAAGIYQLNVTFNGSTCTFYNLLDTVVVNPNPTINLVNLSNVTCFNYGNGSITVVANSTPTYTYQWSNGSTTPNISNLVPGVYTVTASDSFTCNITANYQITQPTPLIANANVTSNYNGQQISCFNASDGTASVVGTGGTAPYSYSWSNGQNTQNAFGLDTGLYVATITDANGCVAIDSIFLSEPTPIVLNTSHTDVTCYGGFNGSINLTATGGTFPYTYLWSNNTNNQNVINLPAAIHTVTVTDVNGCISIIADTVNQPPQPITPSETHVNVACFGDATGSINLSVIGGTPGYTYSWNTGSTNQDIQNLPYGVYTVTITDSNNCLGQYSIVVTQPAAPLSNSAVITPVGCIGDSSGAINMGVSGGTPIYSYVWSNGATSGIISGLPTGTYSVTVTDLVGCILQGSYFVNEPLTAISATATHQDIFCYGAATGSIDLTPAGGTPPYSYFWNNGFVSQDLFNLPAGTYTASVQDGNGCQVFVSQTVVELSIPIVLTETHQDVLCNGFSTGSIDLTVSGGTPAYNYSWSTSSANQDINSLPAGTYTVVVTDAVFCTDTLTVSIAQPANALIITETHVNPSCIGGTSGSINLSVSGGVPGYNFLWNNGETTEDIDTLASGIYQVLVGDSNGCQLPFTIPVIDPSNNMNLTYTYGNVNCFGGADGFVDLTLTGGNPNYYYNWSNGAVVQDITNLAPGNYFVIVTDVIGCSLFMSQLITEPDSALVVISSYNNIPCFGDSTGSVTLNVNGGTLPYNFLWNTGSTQQSLTNLPIGTYSVTVTDANGCSQYISDTLTQPGAALTASIFPTMVVCYGTPSGAANLSVSGGVLPYSYAWTNGSSTEDITAIFAGTYTVTVTDFAGCSITQSITITQPANALSLGVSTVNVSCFGLSNGSINLTPSFGTSPYSYAWSNGASSQDLNNVAAGIYTVTTTDANGCIAILTAQITQPATTLVSTIQHTNVPCHNGASGTGTAAGLGGTPPYSYTWSNGQTTAFVDSLLAGIYSVVISDNNGCTSSQSVLVTQPAPIVIQSANVNNLCFGQTSGSINLTVFGGAVPYAYLWSNGATTDSIGGLGAGPYFVTVTDDNACTATYSDTITQPASSIALSVLITNNLCFGYGNGAIDLTAIGGTAPYQFQWNNGSLSQDIQNLTAGIYTVAVIDQNGCLVTDTFTVNQPPAAAIVTAVNANVSCFGGNNGAINLTVTGPNPPFTYLWSNGATTQDIFNLVPGAYTNNITNANGCVTSYTVNITQPAAPISIQSINTNVLCYAQNTGVIDLSVFGGVAPYTYLWSNLTATQDLNNIPAGIYSVTVTDAGGCQTTFNTQLTQPAAPIAASTATANVLCFGQSTGAIDLTVGGGSAPYVYTWSNAATSQDINGLPIGFYSVLITDANGCTLNAAANIYQPALPVSVSATITPISCFGYQDGAISVVVSGGVPSYALSWSNNQNTFLVDTLVAGFYALQVLDFNGCTSQWNFNVSQPTTPLLLSVAATPASCYNGNNGTVDLTPTGGTAPYTYLWNNGATTQDLNSLLAGSYSVVVSDANGCQATISATILQPQPFSSSATLQNINCYSQNTGAIDLSVVGGTAPYTYLWNNGATTQDLNNILAASYSVSITDANTCVITNTFTLSQPLIPTTLSLQLTQPSCFAASNGSINLSVSSGNASLSYLWNNNQTTQDINNIPSGFYSVSVTDNLGCIDTISTFLNQPDTIGITAILTNPSCPGALNASIDLSITGGTAPYTFTWLSGQNTEDIFNLAQGTYFVTVTDTNGCSKTATFTLVDPVQVASTYTFTPPTCFGGSNATLNVTVTGGAGPYTYLWASGQTTEDLVNVTAGNDTIYITDALGCPHSMVTTITQPDSIQLNFVITNINCFGAANGAIDLSVSGGTPGYTYLWNNAVTTQDLTNVQAGSYFVSVTDASGCIAIDTIQINSALSPLQLSISGVNVSCFNGSNGSINLTTIGGTAPYTILYNTGDITEDLFNLPVGSYSVSVTDSLGCNQTASITISGPVAPLTISAVTNNVQCLNQSNGNINLSVFGGAFPYTYSWTLNNGSVYSTNQDILNVPANVYNVLVTDFNGCTVIGAWSITQPSSGAVISYNVQPVFCFGDSTGWINATVIGGALPYGFSWSNGVNAEDLFNIPSGNYTLTVTDNIGCVTTANILVAQPSGPLFANAIVNNQSCFGFVNASIDANVIGGSAPYSISWNTGQTTSLIGPLVNGNYALNVVDSLGCALDSVFTITQPNPLLIPGAVVNVACFGDSSAYITALPNGGTAPYAYAWNNGQNTQVDTLIPAGNYIVTVTDFNGCIDSALFAVTQPLAPIALTLIQTNVGCFGANTGALDLSVTGGTPAYSYLWSNAFTSQDIQNLSIGNYGVIVTDANGCTDTILTTITQPISPLIVLPTITNSPCFASNGGSIDLNVYGGTTPYTYFWNTTDTTQDLSAVPAGQYSVAVTDANNCVSSLIINITQPASGTNINITQTPASCYGYNDGTMTANVNGGVAPYTVLWNNNLTTSTINNLSAGIYTVTVTDANGCQVSASQLLNQPDSLIAQFNIPDNFGCAPFQAQLINNSIGQYSNVLWTIGNGDILFTADTAYYTFNQVGCYDISLTVTSANGCMATTTANSAICVAQGPIASFYSSPEQIDFYTGDIQFINTSAGANNTYFWNFGDGTQSQTINPFHSYPDQTPATYEVLLIAVDTNGCVDSILQVYELNEIIVMNVPNAFTINEDGLNDAFKPIFSSPESIVKYDFTIFNRWGDIIYQTNDQMDAWDGKYQGKFVQTGAYNWTVNYSDINKADVFAKGHVVVLK